MQSEFQYALEAYIHNVIRQNRSDYLKKELQSPNISDQAVDKQPYGYQYTNLGPAPYPSSGNILDDPELLWTEDQWTSIRKEQAEERLKRQGPALGGHWLEEYCHKHPDKYWDKFYKRNMTNFYKDRHYLHIVFPELGQVQSGLRLLEVGCGVGNAALPLLEVNPKISITAIDFAENAVELLKANPLYIAESHRIQAFTCDIVSESLPSTILQESQDLVLCMFVLSAIHPNNHWKVLEKLTSCLKVGGKLLIRDYGRYDEAQLRFGKGSMLEENLYVRQDGTIAYYFDKDELCSLICQQYTQGMNDNTYEMAMEENEYILRQYANRNQKVARHRVWIHGKYVKR